MGQFHSIRANQAMEKQNEVYHSIGKQTVLKVLEFIQSREITETKLKKIARKIHPHVHGEFVDKRNDKKCELEDVFLYMLDKWYRVKLFKGELDGFQELIQVLRDPTIKLDDLADDLINGPELSIED